VNSKTLQAIEVLSEPDDVREIRALKNGTTASGYFNDLVTLDKEAAKLDAQGFTVYVTANPVAPALLARAENRVQRRPKATTSDRDVIRRHWLLLDFDPVRPAEVSSTDEEKKAALVRAREVREYLRSEGWPEPVMGDSGNGAHLLYRVDLPNDAASFQLVKGVLETLSFKFSDERVSVDTTTSNAARIWKLYGTTARKGDSTEDRPHRVSKLLKVPEERRLVTAGQLQAIAATKPEPPRSERGHRTRLGEYSRFDLDGWIREQGVRVKREGPWQEGYRYVLEECPWNGHTDNAAYILQFPSEAIFAGCQHNSCKTGENRWRELRKHYEPGAYEQHYQTKSSDSANSANSASSDSDSHKEPESWSQPVAFHFIQLPEFPRGVLPEWVEAQAKGVAEATQTPRDLSGMLALGVGAAASAKVVEVEVWDGWKEQTNFYSAVGMRSGSRKTTVFQQMTAPIEEYEAQLVEDTAEEIAEQRTKYKVYEERLKKAQMNAAKADSDNLDTLTADALTAAKDLSSIKVPATPRLLVDDASPERLATILADQGGRIALMSPEGGVFDMMAGRYSQGIPNLDVYLKGHAGDALRVDRVGRPADHVRKPALTISLAVQPDVFQGLAGRPGFRGRGLIGRVAYSIPRDMLGRRAIRPRSVPSAIRLAYKQKVQKLLRLAESLPDGEREAEVLRFGSEAQDEMEVFLQWIEPKLAEDAEFGDMTDWAGKLAGAVARIAGILHMLDHAGEARPWAHPVAGSTVRRAVKIGKYLVPHAKYALAVMGTDPTVEDAKYILRWIERKANGRFTKRDAFEGTKGRFGKVAELEPGLELLIAHGYIREELHADDRRGPGRRPSPTCEVNPLWIAEGGKPKAERDSQNSHYSQNGSNVATRSEGTMQEEDEEVEARL
jgi:hypothetical protein